MCPDVQKVACATHMLVDELSLVVSPVVAGKEDKPLFDGSGMEGYHLQEVK